MTRGEVLLDDSLRLVTRAAAAEVDVSLDGRRWFWGWRRIDWTP